MAAESQGVLHVYFIAQEDRLCRATPPLSSELEASPRSASDCIMADERCSARRMRRRRRRCCAAMVSTMAADMSLGVRSASPKRFASHCAMLDSGVVLRSSPDKVSGNCVLAAQ